MDMSGFSMVENPLSGLIYPNMQGVCAHSWSLRGKRKTCVSMINLNSMCLRHTSTCLSWTTIHLKWTRSHLRWTSSPPKVEYLLPTVARAASNEVFHGVSQRLFALELKTFWSLFSEGSPGEGSWTITPSKRLCWFWVLAEFDGSFFSVWPWVSWW